MEGLSFCSIQMQNKQTLKIDEDYVHNEDLISILPASCSYVDNAYFKKTCFEDISKESTFKNHPVNIRGISIDWIVNHSDEGNNGKKFLEALV